MTEVVALERAGLSVVAAMLRVMTSRPGPCPVCGSRAALPLMLGHPTAEVVAAAERGEVLLGGCVVDVVPGAPWPDAACTSCGARWVADDAAADLGDWLSIT